jgi:3-phosphoshikimate 1-carboxyvinyltransferase
LSDIVTAQPTVSVIPGGPVIGSIRPPGSKSLTNRALLCAAFARGESILSGALCSDDTEVMTVALRKMGVSVVEADGGRTLAVTGLSHRETPSVGHRGDGPLELFIGNSGTTIRFLTAALSAFGGRYRLHGVARMHERPIADLVNALSPICDGKVVCESPGGCPPVSIDTAGWSGARVRVAGNVSSQYLSGLMMAAPVSGRSAEIVVEGELVSRPYVEMTAQIIRDFGVPVELVDQRSGESGQALLCRIDGTVGYQARPYSIEPDASAASYFWAAAAITGGKVTVLGLAEDALQGDVRFVDCLEQMGCLVDRQTDRITVTGPERLRGIDVDMNAISDTVQTLSVVAIFADGPTTIRGVAHNRFKETDRIGDLARELRKFGATVAETDDGLIITPPDPQSLPARAGQSDVIMIDTYDDHRMAMSLSLAGLRIGDVRIRNPACTAKTYPDFFADLERLIGRPHSWRGD